MTDYFDDSGFSDRVLEDAEIFSNSSKVAKLRESAPVMKWVKFYRDIFSMSLNLSEFTILQKSPGASLVLVPKGVSIVGCLNLLDKKIDCKLPLDTNKIKNIRAINGSYVCYRRYKNGLTRCTLLEVLLLNLFSLHFEEKIYAGQPYGLQHTMSRYGSENKQIILKISGSSLAEHELSLFLLK